MEPTHVDDPELALARPASDPDDPEQTEHAGESVSPKEVGFTTVAHDESDPD